MVFQLFIGGIFYYFKTSENIIAIPLGWLFMSKWLENFAYRTNMPWWIFVSAAGLVLLTALITISFQSYQSAIANPADSIRQE